MKIQLATLVLLLAGCSGNATDAPHDAATVGRDVAARPDGSIADAARDISTRLDASDASDAPVTTQLELATLHAFPTAEGWGKNVNGFRDGEVRYVTTLDDAGTGSLRDALESPGPAYVLFSVAGTIVLQSAIIVTPNKYIAGQTAYHNGGEGITLRQEASYSAPLLQLGNGGDGRAGLDAQIVLRFITMARGPGINGENSGDNIAFVYARNFIVDHVSARWSSDENIDFSETSDWTLQNSISSEGLMWSTHEYTWDTTSAGYRDAHSKGLIAGPTTRASLFNNVWVSNSQRNPLIQSPDSGTEIEIHNNYFYNWWSSCVTLNGTSGVFAANITDNFGSWGPDSIRSRYMLSAIGSGHSIYVSNNLDPRAPELVGTAWNVGDRNQNADVLLSPSNQSLTAHDFPLRDYPFATSAAELKAQLFPHVGNSIVRDSHDTRALGYAEAESGGSLVNMDGMADDGYPQLTPFTGGWDARANMSSTPADSDSDGIPDDFSSAYEVTNTAGYPDIELYLAELAGDFVRLSE